jgi:hypothetical protein
VVESVNTAHVPRMTLLLPEVCQSAQGVHENRFDLADVLVQGVELGLKFGLPKVALSQGNGFPLAHRLGLTDPPLGFGQQLLQVSQILVDHSQQPAGLLVAEVAGRHLGTDVLPPRLGFGDALVNQAAVIHGRLVAFLGLGQTLFGMGHTLRGGFDRVFHLRMS